MSKGSKQRPITNKQQFDENWDRIFNKKVDFPKEEDIVNSLQAPPHYAHWVLGVVFPQQEENKNDVLS